MQPQAPIATEPVDRESKSNREHIGFRVPGRYALAAVLIAAGIGHLSWARTAFRAQVPAWVPGDVDAIVLASGAMEIVLGTSMALVRSKWMGWIVGLFFVAVFPGNVAQYVNRVDAFGLDSDTSRAIRLVFQPVLVVWAIWSTADRKPTTRG